MQPTSHDVVITGLGPVSAIGIGVESFWSGLMAGKSSVVDRTLPLDVGKPVSLPIASMPPLETVIELEPYLRFFGEQECPVYRDLAYALLGADLALKDAGIDVNRDQNRIGLIQVFEAPGVEFTVAQLLNMMQGPLPQDGPPPVYDSLAPAFYNMQPFLYVHFAGKALGLHGFSTSVHNACSSGAYALETAAHQVRTGQADIMVVAGGEAFETAVRLEWFRRLNLYGGDTTMRPFNPDSKGFYVGEGGAALILESAEHAKARGATVYAKYGGAAFQQQSWKQTVPDIRAGRLADAISNVLSIADLSPDQIDLVVPHGAATQLSDGYESACLEKSLKPIGDQAVATVFKPSVGHMLAASGLMESICALLSIQRGTIPATLNSSEDQNSLPMPLVTSPLDKQVNAMMKLSTGFTGHDAATVFLRA